MIYMQATLVPAQGKGMEFIGFLASEFIPWFEKCGAKLVGSWSIVVGRRGEIIDLWAFESLTHYDQVMQTMIADNEFASIMEKVYSLSVEENTKIFMPLPFSPLK